MGKVEMVVTGGELSGRSVDVLVGDGEIVEVVDAGAGPSEGVEVVDASGRMILPSLIDCHVHLREPGFEYKEDVESGLRAAAHGGFGQVMAMANTNPVNDRASVTELMLDRNREFWPGGPYVRPVAALTKGLAGKELAPLAELAEAGCVAASNDGMPVSSTEIFRRGMEYAADCGLIVIDHCEDPSLGIGAGVNEGRVSSLLGLKGQPTAAEAIQVSRDVILSAYLDLPVHLAHISCRESVEIIAAAKERGVRVTAETCPHYLIFTEDAVEHYDTAAKVNPPLRTRDDVMAMRQALSSGVIDILVTDHAPHAGYEKETPFADAPNGISGLDTSLSMIWRLVHDGVFSQADMLRAMCHGPGEIFGLSVNRFEPGDPADFLIFDPEDFWEVTPEALNSKGKNTPAMGTALPGRVKAHYMTGGRVA